MCNCTLLTIFKIMEATTIQALFDAKNRKFRIPAYQRSYSWGEKQIKQFIDDLKNASSQYYLGHFLFEKAESNNSLLIIDGQQRLTTCVIFFSSLKKELKRRSENGENITIDLDDIEDYYIKDIRKGIQKFETVEYDNNFFLDEIIDGKNRDNNLKSRSQQRIRKARELFELEFASTKTEDLEKWSSLVQNATITQFVVEDKVQAAQIFAFQNDRGKALSKLEVVKSYFMLQIYLSSDNKELIDTNIRYLEKEFMNIYEKIVLVKTKEDDVLTYYWRTVSGKGYYSDEIVEGTKEALKTISKDKKNGMDKKLYFRTFKGI